MHRFVRLRAEPVSGAGIRHGTLKGLGEGYGPFGKVKDLPFVQPYAAAIITTISLNTLSRKPQTQRFCDTAWAIHDIFPFIIKGTDSEITEKFFRMQVKQPGKQPVLEKRKTIPVPLNGKENGCPKIAGCLLDNLVG
jgi:hypothetical protein